jgi:RNA polymerase sigma factor (sigma-70 family)
MSNINHEDKLRNFISNNPDLIGEYESLNCSVPIEYCEDEILDYSKRLLKVDKCTDFNKALKDALQNSIRNEINIIDSFETLINNALAESQSTNSTQQYFKEINDIYNKHNNDYNIEYSEENREKLIEMNLKSVISIAKKYQGLGLTLQELISAGNLGLVTAWDKFDPSRSKLKDNILQEVEELPDSISYEELANTVHKYMEYGDVKKKFDEKFTPRNTYTKKEIIKWINSNIYNAKFNSIATMWIRAYILIEIDNCSRVVKKPKTEIYKDRGENGSYKKEITLDIDAPISTESDTSFGDLLKLANAQSITNKTGIVSKEYVIAQNVETIFYIDGVTTAKKIASRPGFANIPAVKNNRIYPIKRDLIIEGAYPVEALNYLVAKLRK